MGHVNVQVLKHMSKHNSLKDFSIPPHCVSPHVCRGCALGKQHKATYPLNPLKERSKVHGELPHADLRCKMSQPSLGGTYYYILVQDDCTSYKFVQYSHFVVECRMCWFHV